VAGYVKTNSYSIGYVELSYAISNQMTYAQMRNADDTAFVTPSLESTAAAAAAKASSLPAGDGDWSAIHILNQPGTNTYPIASFTYILIYKELYNDQTKLNKTAAKDLVNFVWWAVHDGGQQYSGPLSYPTLPSSVVTLDEQTLRSITYDGSPLL
jgi:ABC-type phosphate transport system substrate-binding protein